MKPLFPPPKSSGLSVLAIWLSLTFCVTVESAEIPEPVQVEGQPLAANVQRLAQALEFLGAPLPAEIQTALDRAGRNRDALQLQQLLDPRLLFVVSLNPEVRVKVARGPGVAVLQQGGFTPVLIKVINHSTATQPLSISSPQSGPVYAGVAKLSMERQKQEQLRVNENVTGRTDRFLEVNLFTSPPMTARLSGLEVEYVIGLIYSNEAGKREATIAFDVGEGSQDLGFRGEASVLFDIRPAVPVKLSVLDFDGKPTTGRFLFLDRSGHVYPPQPKRLAPDFFFQKHIYRRDGDTVLLPPGEFTMHYGRGPEYHWLQRKIVIPPSQPERRARGSTGDQPTAVELRLKSVGRSVLAEPSKEQSLNRFAARRDGLALPTELLDSTNPSAGGIATPPSISVGQLPTEAGRLPAPPNFQTGSLTHDARVAVRLERWINPMAFGFYGGDHHIHAAGCAHYAAPSEGVLDRDMYLQVKGEGLNVGCILTWGPCFDVQKQFFEPTVNRLSEPLTLLKYDIEVSGFGSQALGHVCLLNLKEQIYPGADSSKGWPTWTTPVLRWAKGQGAFTGYAHSGSGLQVNPAAAGKRILTELDSNQNRRLDREEAARGLLPEEFNATDVNGDDTITETELVSSVNRAADRLPNLAIPELNSVGAQEIFVTTAFGLCDFISAMDTARLLEWNCWYHLLNCGFPLKVSGETDFPCMSGTRVGQGRVYVQLGRVDRIDFGAWCRGMAQGRSYVSDGYAHALEFTVNGSAPGGEVRLERPAEVKVRAKVAFASQTPLEVAHGGVLPVGGMRLVGDTVNLHEASDRPAALFGQGKRLVELVVNGRAVASREVSADDQIHEVEFSAKIDRSGWVALRQFPQLHTNPVNVLVQGQPIRASRKSALWSVGCIEQLWRVRAKAIAEPERAEAQKTFQEAMERYRQIAREAPEGS